MTVVAGRADAHLERGNLERGLLRWEEALVHYDRAIALQPDHAAAFSNRGIVLCSLKRVDAALESFDRAIQLDPENAAAHCNRAFARLLCGDLDGGWPEYEWRWKLLRSAPPSGPPVWLGGTPLAGKCILLRCEQGMGDTLQFCRYVKPLVDLGAQVVLEVQKPLVSLLADLAGVTQVMAHGSPTPGADFQCPLMSLPLAFNTALATIPTPGSYLHGDAFRVAEWHRWLGERARPRIGLVWKGSGVNTQDRERSIPLEELLRHLPDGIDYVSLQKDLAEGDRDTLRAARGVRDASPELDDFSDTAALCECLDLIISVDTSVAHLGGGLGRRTWVLLPCNASWRWLLDREDSPWYTSMRLYRQSMPGDWSGVLERVANDLKMTFATDSATSARDLAPCER